MPRTVGAHGLFVLLTTVTALIAVLIGRESATMVATAAATAIIGWRVLTRRVREPAWLPVLGGTAVLCVDATNSFIHVVVQGGPLPGGPLAAIGLPLGYGVLLIGAILLISSPGRRNLGAVIDAALVAVVIAIGLWSLFLRPHLNAVRPEGPHTYNTIITALILGGITGALLRSWLAGRRHGALGYILLAVSATYAGTIAKILTSDADGTTPWWISLFWAVAYAALAAASAHRSADVVTAPPVDDRLTHTRIIWLGVALGVAPVIATVQSALDRPVDTALLLTSTLVVIPLAMTRVTLLAHLERRAEDTLRHLAQHDELTGIPNRRAGAARLRLTLERLAAGQSAGAVVAYTDLDDFKTINDEYGHAAGDRVLTEIAARLRARFRSDDMVCRFGGDEFVLICEGDPDRLDDRVRELITSALSDPIDVEGTPRTCRASVGTVVVRPGDRATVDMVLSTADARMYQAKGRVARAAGAPT